MLSGRTKETLLFSELARMAERRVCKFNAQGLANTLWASAAVNSYSDYLFGHVFVRQSLRS